jgi:hypothetical protein
LLTTSFANLSLNPTTKEMARNANQRLMGFVSSLEIVTGSKVELISANTNMPRKAPIAGLNAPTETGKSVSLYFGLRY